MKYCATILSAGLALLSCFCASAATGPQVQVTSGRLEGVTHKGVDAFLGIPYAKPPIGELRWQRPLSATPWKGVKKATSFGSSCMQAPVPFKMGTYPENFSEDCLTLNIWRPSHHRRPLPVMVWIHGGGFVNGSSASPSYNGTAFARDGVILVSLNYRLGRFGFFAHPGLDDNMFKGNYGIMDQIKALRWVQDNIIAFGGDPNNVTLFGESAGGFSVGALLTSNFGRNLFQKAIIQSGGGRHNIAPNQTWEQAVKAGIKFAKTHDITGQEKNALQQLRELPAAQLRGDLNMLTMGQQNGTYSGPMQDGRVIASEPETAYKAGDFAHIPLMIGTNSMDLGFPMQAPTSATQVFEQNQLDSQHAKQAYQQEASSPKALAYKISMQKMMTEPARFVARQFAQRNIPTWEYRFGYVAKEKQSQWRGAKHASEIVYVFDTLPAEYDNITARDQHMATLAHRYWVNFAKTGNPNSKGLPEWPQYQAASDQLMWFAPEGASASQAITDPQQAQLDVIANSQQ